jgi:hypothetical protein
MCNRKNVALQVRQSCCGILPQSEIIGASQTTGPTQYLLFMIGMIIWEETFDTRFNVNKSHNVAVGV